MTGKACRNGDGIESVAKRRYIAGALGGAAIAAALVALPALGAPDAATRAARKPAASRIAGAFTPSSADPRLAALFARGGLDTGNFRFTPSDQRNGNRAVTVAVRARGAQPVRDATRLAGNAATVGLAPIAYNLGVSVGWKRFAVTSDVSKVDLAGAPGGREAADLAFSYAGKKVSGRIAASADRALPGAPKLTDEPSSYALDVGGSYSLTRNLALTAGMRYKSERDRLTRLDDDDRRDSQAVYVGTAFRF
jgi:hypothetical protein